MNLHSLLRASGDRFSRNSLSFALALALLCALAACGKKTAAPAGPGAGGPIEVGVVTLKPEPVTLTRELPGRTSAVRVAEVRARVSGIVQKRLFEEGSEVKEGQPLYQIDPAPYEAALESARATLARAEGNYQLAKVQAERNKELVAANAVSQQEYDAAAAALQVASADVAAGKAAVQVATINLDYTHVLAPISGQIGRSEVTKGAYVQQGQATLLATIQQIDQLYVDVSQSSAELLRLKRELANGQLQRVKPDEATVKIILDDGTEYGEAGALKFADITVNPTTGSVVIRALIPNPDHLLLPGLFVRARIEEGIAPAALLVPQQGVSRNQRGEATALVVGADSKAELRVLAADRAIGSRWLITGGAKAGDQVIVQNLQKVRPGAPVKPVPATNIAEPARPAAPQAASANPAAASR